MVASAESTASRLPSLASSFGKPKTYQGAPLTEVLRYRVKFKFVPNPDMTRNGRFPTAVAAPHLGRLRNR